MNNEFEVLADLAQSMGLDANRVVAYALLTATTYAAIEALKTSWKAARLVWHCAGFLREEIADVFRKPAHIPDPLAADILTSLDDIRTRAHAGDVMTPTCRVCLETDSRFPDVMVNGKSVKSHLKTRDLKLINEKARLIDAEQRAIDGRQEYLRLRDVVRGEDDCDLSRN